MNLLFTYKIFITTGWFLVVFILERLFAAVRLPDKLKAKAGFYRIVRNISLSTVNMALSPLIIIPVTAYFSSYSIAWRPLWMQGGGWILLDIMILDGFLYLWHRMVHQLPILWRFHRVHHLDEFLDTKLYIQSKQRLSRFRSAINRSVCKFFLKLLKKILNISLAK